MHNLQEKEPNTRDPDSRPHYHEAVLAYQAGAYRASVVEAWVAVAVDLVFKMRRLMKAGNNQARSATNGSDKMRDFRLGRKPWGILTHRSHP